MPPVYLGIDASTQSMTGTVIDCQNAKILLTESINFQSQLQEYKTTTGVCVSADNPLEVWSYPLMWLDALEMLLEKISAQIDMKSIAAISGSGQQHATVWLNSEAAFSELDFTKTLAENIKPFLSSEKSPIWLDASTSEECTEISECVGGQDCVLQRTGSIATERFSGAQIRKMAKYSPDIYKSTKRIHLNSSFICSAICGKDSPIDYCDATGMNLMNIKKREWDSEMLAVCADNLTDKLPHLVDSRTVVGTVNNYLCKKYGFCENTKVVAFTGDNPSSIVGLGASAKSTAAVSLGTSDTFFCSMEDFCPVENAHVFCNPNGGYMGLACFRNGSLARDNFRKLAGADWKFFDNTAFENYIPSSEDKLILPFIVDEISPKKRASRNIMDNFSAQDSKASRIRAFVEAQVLNIRIQAEKMGVAPSKIILTGGASQSSGIAQTFANVFNCEIFRLAFAQNSAALGAAIRAASFDYNTDFLESEFCPLIPAKKPIPNVVDVYSKKLNSFKKMLNSAE